MPTPAPFFAVIKPAGYPQFPDLMEVTPLPGYMPGHPPARPLPGPTPPGPVDPGYSPPWAQNPVDPGYDIDIGGGYRPPLRPTHPIMLPGMPGWGLPPGGLKPPLPPDAAPPTDETQIIYKYSFSTGLTGPYVVAPAPTPETPPA